MQATCNFYEIRCLEMLAGRFDRDQLQSTPRCGLGSLFADPFEKREQRSSEKIFFQKRLTTFSLTVDASNFHRIENSIVRPAKHFTSETLSL